MNIANKTVLITGANRGIGRALVDEALRRGAKRVYAGTRSGLQHADKRVVRLTLDLTNASQIERAVGAVEALDVLINNAGVATFDDLSDTAATEKILAVNLYGTFNVTRGFLLPIIPAYSISKAALFSLTQSLRAQLARKGVTVHGVFAGPVDTDMSRGFDVPKASPESVAQAIFDGLKEGEEDIFPDSASQTIAESWRTSAAKALEHQNAAFVKGEG